MDDIFGGFLGQTGDPSKLTPEQQAQRLASNWRALADLMAALGW